MSINSRGNINEKLGWTFDLYDTNKDGYISRQEMKHIVNVSNDHFFSFSALVSFLLGKCLLICAFRKLVWETFGIKDTMDKT